MIMESYLNDPSKYNQLQNDPSNAIKTEIVETLTHLIDDGIFTTNELHSICSLTENG